MTNDTTIKTAREYLAAARTAARMEDKASGRKIARLVQAHAAAALQLGANKTGVKTTAIAAGLVGDDVSAKAAKDALVAYWGDGAGSSSSIAQASSWINSLVKAERLTLTDATDDTVAERVQSLYLELMAERKGKSEGEAEGKNEGESEDGTDVVMSGEPITADEVTIARLEAAVAAMQTATKGAEVGLRAMEADQLAYVERLSRELSAAMASFGHARQKTGTLAR